MFPPKWTVDTKPSNQKFSLFIALIRENLCPPAKVDSQPGNEKRKIKEGIFSFKSVVESLPVFQHEHLFLQLRHYPVKSQQAAQCT